jgi:hypothetical protein
MKTAEEWTSIIARSCDDSFCFDQVSAESVIKEIQLDAIKHGMTLAAEKLQKLADKVKGEMTPELCASRGALLGAIDTILTTRDNLKELP